MSIKDKVNEMLSFSQIADSNSALKTKANKIYESALYNPFLDRNGNLLNKYIDYQKVLDNPNVNQKAKDYITKATGLISSLKGTPEPAQKTVFNYTETTSESSNKNSNKNSLGKVGFISAKYESGGYNGGAVSSGNGDYGGVSYGIPQFSTKTGSADNFVNWLKKNNPDIGSYFGNSQAGTTEFSSAWQKAYKDYGDTFSNIQTEYAYNNFVAPLAVLAKEKTGIDYTRSTALKELLYSTAIQFGSGSLGLSALGNVSADMSDKDIINASYDKKISNYKNYFKSSSSAVQEAVKNRFANERNDVLALVG